MYIDKLAGIVYEYNNTYHSSIKMKPVDVNSSTYIGFNLENNKKDPGFEAGDHVRILKYKNIFAKGYIPNLSEEVFVIKKVKNIVTWTYIIGDINEGEFVGTFYEDKKKKTNQSLDRKGNKEKRW